MYLPVEPDRIIEGPVNRGPENRVCTVFVYRDHASGPILWPWVFSRQATSKVIQVSQSQIQTKNYVAKYNANTKTESCW